MTRVTLVELTIARCTRGFPKFDPLLNVGSIGSPVHLLTIIIQSLPDFIELLVEVICDEALLNISRQPSNFNPCWMNFTVRGHSMVLHGPDAKVDQVCI